MTSPIEPQLGDVLGPLEPRTVVGHANLTLVPLWGEGHRHSPYDPGAAAIEAGTLEVTEVDADGSVPDLLAMNGSDRPALLLNGEELTGAKQNRILNTTVLIPGRSKTLIPVSCVEEGRWHNTGRTMKPKGTSPTAVRTLNCQSASASLASGSEARSDQGRVWDSVEEILCQANTDSPTRALDDVRRHHKGTIDRYLAALPYPVGCRGVLAACGGDLLVVDVFDCPETMAHYWPGLISGYAMDAMARRRPKQPGQFTEKGASVLLEQVASVPCTPYPSMGLGSDWRFAAENVQGQALVDEQVAVHLSVFPTIGTDPRPEPLPERTTVSPIRRPRQDRPGEYLM